MQRRMKPVPPPPQAEPNIDIFGPPSRGSHELYHATPRDPYSEETPPRLTAQEMALLRKYQPALESPEPFWSRYDMPREAVRAEMLLNRLREARDSRGQY